MIFNNINFSQILRLFIACFFIFLGLFVLNSDKKQKVKRSNEVYTQTTEEEMKEFSCNDKYPLFKTDI